MTRQQRKDARAIEDMEKDASARSYSAVRAVACRQVRLDYHAVSLPSGANARNLHTRHVPDADAPESWEMTQPDSLGRLIPEGGWAPFPGQTRANGRPL